MRSSEMDIYANYQQLQRSEIINKDFRILWREGSSGIAILSIHGGEIEPGTTQLADMIAGWDHSFYTFQGIKPRGNLGLHITSNHFDEPIALEIVCISEIIVSIHGCKDEEPLVYVGGQDQEIGNLIRKELAEVGLPAVECVGMELSGENDRNICNLCGRGMGVQLEISRGLRMQMFRDLTPEGRTHRTEVFYRFVEAVRAALSPYAMMLLEGTPLQGTD
ncbi:poly-gamma-glutamate hydrolase family protein [Desulfatirhabdium butyrativorans]|uniref:poly-gamma-glutamate hydrolase family protein n=1 Tax=Desulfatirhabdium butyrativorans TaxID=340467 RepID=UPI0009FCD10B|nr:poly-gamma-glutamate hydrolase family protein [Desulfatirhabdium butyrativorans]